MEIATCNSICGPWSNTAQATPDAAPSASDLSSTVTAGNTYNFAWDTPVSNGCAVSEMGWSVDASGGPWNNVPLTSGETSVSGSYGQPHPLSHGHRHLRPFLGLAVTASSVQVDTYNNYSSNRAGVPMCRGNPELSIWTRCSGRILQPDNDRPFRCRHYQSSHH